MTGKRFRKLSLRILIFVILPLSALAFLIGTRVMSAQKQVATLRRLVDSKVAAGWSFVESDVWWEAFWGGHPVGKIEMVMINGTADGLAAIAPMTNLKWLKLTNPAAEFSAQSVRSIASAHPRLESLLVTSGQLSSETWRAISQLSNLQSLEVAGGNLTDDDLREFENSGWTELSIAHCQQLSDRCCQSIAKMRGLKRLALQSVAITDSGVQQFGELTDLEVLNLGNTGVAGAGLEVLRKMPRLKALSLSQCPINDIGFDHVAAIHRLHLLHLDGTSLDDQRLKHLTHMTELRSLSVSSTKITNDGIRHLLRFPALNDLNLNFTPVDDEGIRRLAGLKDLRKLSCFGTYTSPDALNLLGSQITHDRLSDTVTIQWDGAACVDTETCEVVGYVPVFPDDLANNKGVAGTKRAGCVFVFPLQRGEPFLLIPARQMTAMLSAGGNRLVTVGFNDFDTYDLTSRQRLSSTNVTGAFTMLVGLVGDRVISRDGRKFIARDFATGNVLWTTTVLSRTLQNDQIAANHERLILSTPAGVDFIDLTTGRSARVGERFLDLFTDEVVWTHLVGFTDEGRAIAAQVFEYGPIKIGDLASSQLIAIIDVTADRAVMSENAKYIATHVQDESAVTIWDAMTGKRIGSVQVRIRDRQMMFTPDGRYLIVDVDPAAIDEKYRQ